MATAQEAHNWALEPQTLARVEFFMHEAAIAVMAELATTANHAERVTYAKMILAGTANIREYSIGCATNATIQAAVPTVTDSDLEFTVNSIFNAHAGIST